MTELSAQAEHREWLRKIKGTVISEIKAANQMVGLEGIPLACLVVSDTDLGWENIKQPIIPLEIAVSADESFNIVTRRLKMLRAQINSESAFLVLVKDEQMGGENGWALSIINPHELKLTEEQLQSGMEVSYMTGQLVLGSSSRAALLAKTGKTSL